MAAVLKKQLKLALAFTLLLFSAGCYGYHEVDESAFVIAVGLDRGRENVIKVTTMVAVPRNIAVGGGVGAGGGGGGGEENTLVVSMESPTFLSSLEMLNAFVDRRADMTHNRAIVISRDLAEEDIGRYLNSFVRFPQFRRHTYIMVTEGSASDFIREIKPILEVNPAKYIELLMMNKNYTEFIPNSTVFEYYNDLRSLAVSPIMALVGLEREEPGPTDPSPKSKGSFIAGQIPAEGGGKPEIMGAAVFRDGRMVGTINGDEVGFTKMVRGDLQWKMMSVMDPLHPGKFVVFEITPQKPPEIRADLEGEAPYIEARVFLEGTMVSVQSGERYERPELTPLIQQAVEARLTRETMEFVRKMQQEFRTDVFGFGRVARKQFLTWPEWEEYGWLERFPEAEIEVSYEFRVRRTGLLHETYRIANRGICHD